MNIHVSAPTAGPVAKYAREWRFNANDRIRFNGGDYVHAGSAKGSHLFQRIIDGQIEDFTRRLTNDEITQQVKRASCASTKGFFERRATNSVFGSRGRSSTISGSIRPDRPVEA